MAHLSDDDCWSTDTYGLAEVPHSVVLPTLVRVTEGIYSTQDCSTFSQGDIIRIDGCETIEMVGAHLALLDYGSFRIQGKELFVPLNYKGRVRVCSVHGSCQQYTSVEELINYFPKFVKLSESLSFTNNKGQTFCLKANDTIELLKLIGSRETGAIALRVRQNNSEIILPRSLKGLFMDVDFTIADVMKFTMPQCIKFLGQDINLFTSKDIQEAAANIDHYDGFLMLSGKRKNRMVLVGHYKSLETDPSSRFCRRSAVVLPMDNPDIASIQVQVPIRMDTPDYEVFVLKHFSENDVSQSIEGLLYIEFSKNPAVTFLKDPSSSPPAILPRTDHGSEHLSSQPPPRPPKPGQHLDRTDLKHPQPTSSPAIPAKQAVKPNIRKSQQSTKLSDGYEIPHPVKVARTPPTQTVAPIEKGNDAARNASAANTTDDVSRFLVADLFSAFSVGHQEDDEVDNSDMKITYENCDGMSKKPSKGKGFLHKFKKKFVPKPHGDTKEEEKEYKEEADVEAVYDYVDENSLLSIHARHLLDKNECGAHDDGDSRAKTAVVQPFQMDGQMPEKKFKNLSVDELRACFQRCALDRLAEIVHSERLDGELFSSLSDDDLKKEPIFLNNLNIKKVRQIQKGWRPNIQ